MSNHLDAWIQTYPDFPKPGILFYDIAPIIEHADRLARSANSSEMRSMNGSPTS